MLIAKKILLAAAAVTSIAAGANAGIVAPSVNGPDTHGHTFTVVHDRNISWEAAEAAARARGGFLVTIGDADEQRAVEQVLTKARARAGTYWFGLRESQTEGDFRHITGATPGFTNWLAGQPDNAGAAGENSGAVVWSPRGQSTSARRGSWIDLPNVNRNFAAAARDLRPQGYIIEFKGNGSSFDNGDRDPAIGNSNFVDNSGGAGGTDTPPVVTPPVITPPVTTPPVTTPGTGATPGTGGIVDGGGGVTPTPGTGTDGSGNGTGGSGPDTGGNGGVGNPPNSIPLPTALYLFPTGLVVAGYAAKKMRKFLR